MNQLRKTTAMFVSLAEAATKKGPPDPRPSKRFTSKRRRLRRRTLKARRVTLRSFTLYAHRSNIAVVSAEGAIVGTAKPTEQPLSDFARAKLEGKTQRQIRMERDEALKKKLGFA